MKNLLLAVVGALVALCFACQPQSTTSKVGTVGSGSRVDRIDTPKDENGDPVDGGSSEDGGSCGNGNCEGTDAGTDGGSSEDGGSCGNGNCEGTDAGTDGGSSEDGGSCNTGNCEGTDAGADGGSSEDGGSCNTGNCEGTDAGADGGSDAGTDGGTDSCGIGEGPSTNIAGCGCPQPPLNPTKYLVNLRTGEIDHAYRTAVDILQLDCDTEGPVGQNPLCQVGVALGFVNPMKDPTTGIITGYCVNNGRFGWVFRETTDRPGIYVNATGTDDQRLKIAVGAFPAVLYSDEKGYRVFYEPYTDATGADGFRRRVARGLRVNGSLNAGYGDRCHYAEDSHGEPWALTRHQTTDTDLTVDDVGPGRMSYTISGATNQTVYISQNVSSGPTNGLRIASHEFTGVDDIWRLDYVDILAMDGKFHTFSPTTLLDRSIVPIGPGSYRYEEDVLVDQGPLTPPEFYFLLSEPDDMPYKLNAGPGNLEIVRDNTTQAPIETVSVDPLGRFTQETWPGGSRLITGYDGAWRARGARSTAGSGTSLVATEVAYVFDVDDPNSGYTGSGLLARTTETSTLGSTVETVTTYPGGTDGLPIETVTKVGGVDAVRETPQFVRNLETGYPVVRRIEQQYYGTVLGTQVTQSFTISTPTDSQLIIASDNNPLYQATINTDPRGYFASEQDSSPWVTESNTIDSRGPGGYVSGATSTYRENGGPELRSTAGLGISARGINYNSNSYPPLVTSSSGSVTTTNGRDTRIERRQSALGFDEGIRSERPDPQHQTLNTRMNGPGISSFSRGNCTEDEHGQQRCSFNGTTSLGDPDYTTSSNGQSPP